MHTDVDGGAAAGMLLQDKAWCGDKTGAPQHPAARVINVAQRATINLGLERPGRAAKAEVLCGHQQLAGCIAGSDHVADFTRRGRQWLLADDVLARLQRRNAERRVIAVRRADVDYVDVGIAEQRGRVRFQACDAVLFAPDLQGGLADVAAGHHFCVFRSGPARHVRAGDTAHTDYANLQGHVSLLGYLSRRTSAPLV